MAQAGGQGLFAIEKSPEAFGTFGMNFLASTRRRAESKQPVQQFLWPDWLPQQPHDITEVLDLYSDHLVNLKGKVDVVVGGPPCQGFSTYGCRDPRDPRNSLIGAFLEFVRLVEPKIVLLENVRGIDMPFTTANRKELGACHGRTVADELVQSFEDLGFSVASKTLCASQFGVPQRRERFFILGVASCVGGTRDWDITNNEILSSRRREFLEALGMSIDEKVSVAQAISDLEVERNRLIDCHDPLGTYQIEYSGPKTSYQHSLNAGVAYSDLNSLRLANHRLDTIIRFQAIQGICIPGRKVPAEVRKLLSMKKFRIHYLSRDQISPTLTTLPDDLLHYSEPRVLTVREMARLQSFPDWFRFSGPFGTGGAERRRKCPRYTQVGNAVPVRLAAFLGGIIGDMVQGVAQSTDVRLDQFQVAGADGEPVVAEVNG